MPLPSAQSVLTVANMTRTVRGSRRRVLQTHTSWVGGTNAGDRPVGLVGSMIIKFSLSGADEASPGLSPAVLRCWAQSPLHLPLPFSSPLRLGHGLRLVMLQRGCSDRPQLND